MTRIAAIVAVTLSLTSAATDVRLAGLVSPQATGSDDWKTFAGTWSARGERQTIPTGGGRDAAIVRLSGTVMVVPGTDLAGFLGEAIAFDDGRTLSVGSAVWTDSRGDRVFSDLKGEPVAAGRRIVGTITGGTGRYAGIVGDYELMWQYVAQDGGDVQGRASDLKGKFRKGAGR